MKIGVKKLIRDEKGQVLIMALILLLISGLIVAPLLSYMNTGLTAGGVYERKADELYAADAGVEDAIWKIQQGIGLCLNQATNYTIADVNGKSVEVTITYTYEDEEGQAYLVESTAPADGSGTKIEAYVTGTSEYGDFSGITSNVITSQGDIDYPPHPDINPSEGEHAPAANYTDAWPTAEDLCAWYGEDVEGATHYDGDTEIDLRGNNCPLGPIYINDEAVNCPSGLGPLSINGTLVEITNSQNPQATLVLAGTIYIDGDAIINPTKDLILDLNGYAIFVNGALDIKGKCGIKGPGVIIAVGDVWFEPNIEAGDTDPVFIMSVEGTTNFQPGIDFYGSVAGSVEVDIQPGGSLNYPEAGFGVINLPGCTAGRFVYSIASWDVGPPE